MKHEALKQIENQDYCEREREREVPSIVETCSEKK